MAEPERAAETARRPRAKDICYALGVATTGDARRRSPRSSAKVLAVAEDTTANATVRLGQRSLARLPGTRLDEAVTDVADRPGDEDFSHALRAQVHKALADDLSELLATAGVRLSAASAGSVAVESAACWGAGTAIPC